MSDPKKWERISTETVFEKYGRKVNKVIFRMPDGTESDFYIKVENPTCGCVAITKDNQVILARQYRPGPDEITYDIPGGYVDQGEDPTVAMERELLEETGYKGTIQPVSVIMDNAYSSTRIHCFVVTDCVKVSEPKLESDEYLNVELVSLSDFRNILKSGAMNDIDIGYLCLDHLNLL